MGNNIYYALIALSVCSLLSSSVSVGLAVAKVSFALRLWSQIVTLLGGPSAQNQAGAICPSTDFTNYKTNDALDIVDGSKECPTIPDRTKNPYLVTGKPGSSGITGSTTGSSMGSAV